MSSLQVHPHFGYLNSDVCLINKSESSITVKDVIEGGSYEIPAFSNILTRLTAGEHRFIVNDDESCFETVVVEDAIKYGGSKEKKTYVFEGTSWSLMVMLDRTYFFNRETSEQYVEHGLVPQNVFFLTSDYLLFASEGDHSIFSLNSLSVEETLGETRYLYSNNRVAVFSSNSDIILYSLNLEDKDRISLIECDDYIVDTSAQVLFYHKRGLDQIVSRALGSSFPQELEIEIPTGFRKLIGRRSVVYGASPQSLGVMNLYTRESVLLYEGIIPVNRINDKEVWTNGALQLIRESNSDEDVFTSYAELSVFERGKRWFFVEHVHHILKNRGVKSESSTYSLHLSDKKETYLESSDDITVILGSAFDCVKNNNNDGLLVFPDSITKYEGLPIASPTNEILIFKRQRPSQGEITYPPRPSLCTVSDPRKPGFSVSSKDPSLETLFRKTGLVCFYEGNTGNQSYYNSTTGQIFSKVYYDETSIDGFYRVFGSERNTIHSLNGDSRPMPCIKDRLIAVSEKCNYAIIRDETGIVALRYDDGVNDWIGTALERMEIDDSFYSKAVFCSDCNSIVYQKKGNEYYLRKIGSDEEDVFEFQNSVVKRNINGYLPYMDFDTHRRPVYVDPVSLTRIEEAAVGQFTFQSVNGKFRHIGHNIVKYYNRLSNRYVPKQEYDLCVEKYDYDSVLGSPFTNSIRNGDRYEMKRENRVKFYHNNQKWLNNQVKSPRAYSLNKCYSLPHFLEMDSICDGLLFKKEYYIREEYCGETIDILLPQELYFLNYVSFSYDDRYIIISGRFPTNNFNRGLALVYDVEQRKTIYMSTSSKAVWLGVFSKNGTAAYYDSTPNTYFSGWMGKNQPFTVLNNRSFLTFSPSGKYMALSCQGYIPFNPGTLHWGHQPSRDVYIVSCDKPHTELNHFRDHGDQIEGIDYMTRSNLSVASASFSVDDKKLMTVSKDGVVVVRNLHLEDKETVTCEEEN